MSLLISSLALCTGAKLATYKQVRKPSQAKSTGWLTTVKVAALVGIGSLAAVWGRGESAKSADQVKPTCTAPLTLTDDTFQAAVLANDQLTVVDFWAAWCGPCQKMGPIIERLAKRYAGRVTVAKLNLEAHEVTANTYQINSIPTLVFFKDGKEIDRITGLQSEKALQEAIDKHLVD